ncbi:MAG: DUF6198 family protein [Oscillospiraceae bacterium]|nr:DUF6198 family protein [Oscillospiraceae bacterium]
MFLAGVCVSALGVALASKSDLGVTPLSLPAYVFSHAFPLSMGQFLILQHAAFLLLQALLLGREFRLSSLLQLPLAIVYGEVTDLALWCLGGFEAASYAARLALCAAGIVVTGIGVFLMVNAGVLVLAGEGLSLAIARRTGLAFSTVKIAVDCGLLLLSAGMSRILLGRIVGIREGTVAAAILVGLVVKAIQSLRSPRTDTEPRREPLARGSESPS